MRIYPDELERTVRQQRLAHEWTGSQLIDSAQYEKIAADLHVGARRTNRFIRLILFGFAANIIRAAVTLVAVTSGVKDSTTLAVLCLIAAAACVALAELLIRRFRAYHFGVEEACALAAVALGAIAASMCANSLPGKGPILLALSAASIAAFAVYRRYGYVYAAIGAMACAAVLPFQLNLPGAAQRLLAAAVLAVCAVTARMKRRTYGDEFPGDEYAAIEASAWLGLYASLNLQLFSPSRLAVATPFYWLTFAGWLATAEGEARHGFTATRLLRSDRDALAAVGILATPFHPAPAPSHVDPPAPDPFDGSRSGGGGGGASF